MYDWAEINRRRRIHQGLERPFEKAESSIRQSVLIVTFCFSFATGLAFASVFITKKYDAPAVDWFDSSMKRIDAKIQETRKITDSDD
jgi:hypothetical protein